MRRLLHFPGDLQTSLGLAQGTIRPVLVVVDAVDAQSPIDHHGSIISADSARNAASFRLQFKPELFGQLNCRVVVGAVETELGFVAVQNGPAGGIFIGCFESGT